MYGIATGIRTFEDLVQQQQQSSSSSQKEQPPIKACAPGGTALYDFLLQSFPGIQLTEIYGADTEIDQAFVDDVCHVYITDAPIVTQLVLNRYKQDKCYYNNKPVGLIGEPMQFGLSHYAIGVRKDIPREVVDTISYWMSVLMSCNPLDPDGQCPEGGFSDFYKGQGGSGSECGFVMFPPSSSVVGHPGVISGIVIGGMVFVLVISWTVHNYRIKRQQKHMQKVKDRVATLESYRKQLEVANSRVVQASAEQLKHFACMSHEVKYSN